MPILKFWKKDDSNIILDSMRMEDITQDKRTKLLNKASFLQEKYKIDERVYMAFNDTFFKFAKIFNRSSEPISAMLIKENENNILVMPSKSYVFWNGKSVEPLQYNL